MAQPTCCEFMTRQLNYQCAAHPDQCPDQVLSYRSNFYMGTGNPRAEQVLLISPNAQYEYNYCPSCGTKIIFTTENKHVRKDLEAVQRHLERVSK